MASEKVSPINSNATNAQIMVQLARMDERLKVIERELEEVKHDTSEVKTMAARYKGAFAFVLAVGTIVGAILGGLGQWFGRS